jgi:hypothetical protein
MTALLRWDSKNFGLPDRMPAEISPRNDFTEAVDRPEEALAAAVDHAPRASEATKRKITPLLRERPPFAITPPKGSDELASRPPRS